jgi:hypothetical protein
MAARDEGEIEEEEDGRNGNDGVEGDDDEEDEVFDADEINTTSYIHMETPIFWLPLNLDWREKISYKGKTDLVREKKEIKSKAY